MLNLFREQPRAFHIIFMVELWERFGFYSVQGILILYFIRFLGFTDNQAYLTFGAFSALVYSMVALGGFLGDKIIGTKRMIFLGLIILALGYLALSLSSPKFVFFSLGLICVGNGLFKANPSSFLSKCYQPHDTRLHSGFTLYYMSINVGSIAALFVSPYLSSHYGYFYAYFLSFIGLVLGVNSFWLQRKYLAEINTPADKIVLTSIQWVFILLLIGLLTIVSAYLLQHVTLAKTLTFLITLVVIGIYGVYMYHENFNTRIKMGVAFLLMAEAIIFFVLYQQMPTSLNLFAVNNVKPILLGIPIDPQSFQVLNPLWIIIMSPVLAKFYNHIEQRKGYFPITYKFVSGMMCCSLSFGLLFFARFTPNEVGVVSSWWLIASYFFQSTGELLVSALGVAMIAELVPASITGFVMGMWFLSVSIASFIGSSIASYTALPINFYPGIESLTIYTNVFGWIGLISFIITLIMAAIAAFLTKYLII